MADNPKFTDRAADLANQAAAAAAPHVATAKERAAQAAAAAGPAAIQARDKAAKAAAAAAPKAQQGVNALAGNLDKATGGKYSSRIKSVAGKLGKALSDLEAREADKPAAPPATPPSDSGPTGS